MNKDFQDRIDEYLRHADAMTQDAKALLLQEAEGDAEKRELLEFTRLVVEALVSRGTKLRAMAEFQKEMLKHRHKTVRLWISAIAAVLVVGFFAVSPLLVGNSQDGGVRGGDDVFDTTTPSDTTKTDSTAADTVATFPDK